MARGHGAGHTPLAPGKALLLQLLHHTPQRLAGLLQPLLIGGQAQADALHPQAAAPLAAGQRPPQGQALTAPLQPQAHAAGRQLGVVLADRPVEGMGW